MVFEKRVPWSVFGRPGGGDTYVAVTVVPMGWSASVDLIQNFLRRLVYHANLVDPSCELRVGQEFPLEQGAVTCLNGFDLSPGSRLWLRVLAVVVCTRLLSSSKLARKWDSH